MYDALAFTDRHSDTINKVYFDPEQSFFSTQEAIRLLIYRTRTQRAYMKHFITQYYYPLLIKFLAAFKPSILFEKINHLSWYKAMQKQWLNDQHIMTPSQILEIGCATGMLTNYIHHLGHQPIGIDYSDKMVHRAKNLYPNTHFSVASVLDLPFTNCVFDVVIAASLINIVSDRKKAMSELYRTCVTGGKISILVPCSTFTDENLHTLQIALNTSGFSFHALEAWHRLAPKMDIDETSNLLKDVGLTHIRVKEYLQGMVIVVTGIKQ